jgi:NADH:ubiquinone oxidoreductase subunit 6 (subunit J)
LSGLGVVAAFWFFTLLSIASALYIIAARNLVHAVLALIVSFVGVAGLFVTLSADFVAVAQVLVYAGAIGVLTIFAIMLTPRAGRENANSPLFWPATVLAVMLFGVIAIAALATAWPVQGRPGFDTTAAAIGTAILSRYALPFEIVSVVLLAALIGAIVIVRSEPVGVTEGTPRAGEGSGA